MKKLLILCLLILPGCWWNTSSPTEITPIYQPTQSQTVAWNIKDGESIGMSIVSWKIIINNAQGPDKIIKIKIVAYDKSSTPVGADDIITKINSGEIQTASNDFDLPTNYAQRIHHMTYLIQ
jgi:hypothetical protein